jgi:hypothetical protein
MINEIDFIIKDWKNMSFKIRLQLALSFAGFILGVAAMVISILNVAGVLPISSR